MRIAILSLCLAGLVATTVLVDALADETDGCKEFAWDVSHELTVMKQTPAPITAATKPGAQAPLVKMDKLYELKLSPQAAVTYSANPAKPTLNDSAQNGAESSGARDVGSSLPGMTPVTGGTSSGDGR